MIKVFLGSNLKNFTNGVEELEVEATSVKSLISEMDRRYPGIADALESGFALAIDGEVIANPGYEKLAEVSEVRFLSPMRGG
jgi:molybdopterin converting factor small subunit